MRQGLRRALIAIGALAFASAASADTAAGPRPLTTETWPQLAATLKDRPTIVHVWGVTCSICMVELPEWGAFAARHPEVRIVLVNWDREPDPARISTTLGKANLASVESWGLAQGFEEKVRFAFDRDWMGEMPRTRLISSSGASISYSGAADFAKLAAWIETGQYPE